MKYRIVKEDGRIKIQECGFWTLFMWRTWSRYGGSFGNEDFEFETVEDAERCISQNTSKPFTEVLKEIR